MTLFNASVPRFPHLTDGNHITHHSKVEPFELMDEEQCLPWSEGLVPRDIIISIFTVLFSIKRPGAVKWGLGLIPTLQGCCKDKGRKEIQAACVKFTASKCSGTWWVAPLTSVHAPGIHEETQEHGLRLPKTIGKNNCRKGSGRPQSPSRNLGPCGREATRLKSRGILPEGPLWELDLGG